MAVCCDLPSEVGFTSALNWRGETFGDVSLYVPVHPGVVWVGNADAVEAHLTKMVDAAKIPFIGALPALVWYKEGSAPRLLATLTPEAMALVVKLVLSGVVNLLGGVQEGTEGFTLVEGIAMLALIEQQARAVYAEKMMSTRLHAVSIG